MGTRLLPVDSEHNAIFQALGDADPDTIEMMTLTASGGPFRSWTAEAIAKATPEEALKHPNWAMGPKVTIDSAGLMNKGLEVIEAHHIFGIEAERLDVLVHAQSVVHGLVAFRDGSVTAGLAAPDMRVPIAHCLSYPRAADDAGAPARSCRRRAIDLRAAGFRPLSRLASGPGCLAHRPGPVRGRALAGARGVERHPQGQETGEIGLFEGERRLRRDRAGAPASASRSGKPRQWAIGTRMSGGARPAVTEPSQKETRPCTIDCGWTRTSSCSAGMPKR